MRTRQIIGVVAVLAILGGGYLLTKNAGASTGQTSSISLDSTSGQPTSTPLSSPLVSTTTTNQQQKFSSSANSQYAYQIFPGTLSTQARQALSGFSMQTQTDADGATVVTLTAQESQYQSQQYTVKPGETLYFIEKSLGDDPSESKDTNLGDDSSVLVDSNGYIIQ